MLLGIHSPPIVVRDRVIHGSAGCRPPHHEGGGARLGPCLGRPHRRARLGLPYRARTATDEFGVDTWLNESWRYSGNANVWSMLAGDNELGHVYLPTGTPTNDYYGVDRPGDNLFAETLIAVDVETGQRVWHFQAVHHGLWDYDFATHPNVVDIDGRRPSHPGRSRRSASRDSSTSSTAPRGSPIWPIEERPVPQGSNMPGEVLSPTQPFPTKPAPFDYQGVTVDDLVDFTPEIRQMALAAVEGFRLGPLFTPLDLVDRGRHARHPHAARRRAAPRVGPGPPSTPRPGCSTSRHATRRRSSLSISPIRLSARRSRYTHGAPEAERLAGGGNIRREPQMPQGLPLVKPPYSRMTAIDLNTGEHAWWVPTGNGDRYRNHPLLRDLDLPPLGGDNAINGPLLTSTLLIYCLTAGGTEQRPAAGRLRQVGRHGARLGGSPLRRHRDADDLHGRRPAVHRAHRRRRPAADLVRAPGRLRLQERSVAVLDLVLSGQATTRA